MDACLLCSSPCLPRLAPAMLLHCRNILSNLVPFKVALWPHNLV